MSGSRWERIYDLVYDKFGIKEEFAREIDMKKGEKGKEEVIVFLSPKGKMKLVRLIKPKVMEIKHHYSRRTSRGAYQEACYSPTEKVETIKLYLQDRKTEKWEEINLSGL